MDQFTQLFDNAEALQGVGAGQSPRKEITNALEALFDECLDAIQPDLVLEVGAFEAAFSQRCAERFPSASVIAFEANPRVHEFYAPKLDTKIDYRFQAVTDQPGSIEIHIPDIVRGVKKPTLNRMASIREIAYRDSEMETVTVPATTLDLVTEGIATERAIMWIDVEGACDFVLRGAGSVLAKTAAVMIELETSAARKDQALAPEIINMLEAKGFTALARDCQRQAQFNAIFINRALVADPDRIDSAIERFTAECHKQLATALE